MPLEAFWRRADAAVERAALRLQQSTESRESSDRHAELIELSAGFPDRLLYLDLETCGFAGSMVFLIGLIHGRSGQLTLTQLLARDYSQEKAILHTLWERAGDKRVLVTFNGKSFDWPVVHDRSTLHHLGRRLTQAPRAETAAAAVQAPRTRRDPRPELAHCDLLHHARRRWRSRLPNCRLQTLERYVCGRRRSDDIPSADIPAVYHHFVRTGDQRQMSRVLHHNALDLVTLVQLSIALGEGS